MRLFIGMAISSVVAGLGLGSLLPVVARSPRLSRRLEATSSSPAKPRALRPTLGWRSSGENRAAFAPPEPGPRAGGASSALAARPRARAGGGCDQPPGERL